jgi:hypothetical protein
LRGNYLRGEKVMKRVKRVAVLAIAVSVLSQSAFAGITEAQKKKKESYRKDFKNLVSVIEENYAPLEYKKDQINLKWKSVKAKYTTKASLSLTDDQYLKNVTKFLAELEDVHVGIQLPSKYYEYLPMQLTYVEGETVISYIDREELPREKCPVNIGDKIVAIDGKSPEKLRKEYKKYTDLNKVDSNNIIHTLMLTRRSKGNGAPVESKEKKASEVIVKGDAYDITCVVDFNQKHIEQQNLDDSVKEKAKKNSVNLLMESRKHRRKLVKDS